LGDVPGAGGSAQDRRVRVHRLAGDSAHHMDTEFQAQGVDAPREGLEAGAPGRRGETVRCGDQP
jgi:hypothetical protein